MRRLLLITVVLLLGVPALAGAGRRVPGDGTLEVQSGRGLVDVQARGGIIGRFDTGRLIIDDPIEGDGSGPIVYGAERIRELGPTRTLYIGEDVRFRLIGGGWKVRIIAVGMWVSVVGRGQAVLDDGEPSFTDSGRFSVNGGPFQPMPTAPTRVRLGLLPPGPPGGGGK